MRSPFQKSQKHPRNHWLLIYRGILLRLKNVKEQCKKIPIRYRDFFCLVYRYWWRVADARSLVCVGRAAAALS